MANTKASNGTSLKYFIENRDRRNAENQGKMPFQGKIDE